MEIIVHHDMRIATCSRYETLDPAVLSDPTLNIVRIIDPTPEQCIELGPSGFLFKPQWLFWSRPVYESTEAYLNTLQVSVRSATRQSLRRIGTRFRLEVETPLDPLRFECWYELYQRHIASLPRGTPYAADDRDDLLARPERVIGVYLYDGERMVAGVITLKMPQHNMLRITYYACDSAYRHLDVTRYMYVQTGLVAVEHGYERLAAGADPNFYGHDVATGLYLFKKRLGFRIDPLWRYEADDPPVLERVISLRNCDDPCFCLSYNSADPTTAALVGHVFSHKEHPDQTPFEALFLSQIVCHQIAPDAQEV